MTRKSFPLFLLKKKFWRKKKLILELITNSKAWRSYNPVRAGRADSRLIVLNSEDKQVQQPEIKRLIHYRKTKRFIFNKMNLDAVTLAQIPTICCTIHISQNWAHASSSSSSLSIYALNKPNYFITLQTLAYFVFSLGRKEMIGVKFVQKSEDFSF